MTTYACICVEVDLSVGFLEKITLKWNSKTWVQQLDYENTSSRYRICNKTGHLQKAKEGDSRSENLGLLCRRKSKLKVGQPKTRRYRLEKVPIGVDEENKEHQVSN